MTPQPVPGPRFLVPAVLICFAVIGSILYARTLHIPWVFDDIQNIVENPLIRDFGQAFRRIGNARGVAFLTFALNYNFWGLELPSFHAVNIAIHIGSSWLVFLIMRRIFRDRFLLPFAGGLIFLVHPLQTQAVNYVVQRMASMCGFFMLAAIYFYMCFRQGPEVGDRGPGTSDQGTGNGDQGTEVGDQGVLRRGPGTSDQGLGTSEQGPLCGCSGSPATDLSGSGVLPGPRSPVSPLLMSHPVPGPRSLVPGPPASDVSPGPRSLVPGPYIFYLLSLIACILALWTKQNAVVLPVALLLVDRYFCAPPRGGWKRLFLYLLPFLLITAGNATQQLREHRVVLKEAQLAQYWAKANETSANLKVAAKEGASLVKPPKNLQAIYLVTEFSVLWLYMRLLFFPVGQIFDYGYPLVSDLVTFQNCAALLGHLLLVGLAVWLRNRRPLLSFGILWFYLTLAVESSIIPLDAVMEHRLYLTLFGFALVVLDLARLIPRPRLAGCGIAAAIVVLAVLTWERNALWSDPVAFAEDNVKKAPYNQRNYLTLATAYADADRWRDAEFTLRRAILLRPDYPVPYENLGSTLVQLGRYREAVSFYLKALELSPGNPTILYNAGLALVRMGNTAAAHEYVSSLKAANSPLAGQLEAMVSGSGNK